MGALTAARGIKAVLRAVAGGITSGNGTPPITDTFSGAFSSTNWAGSTYGSPANVAGQLQLPCTSGYPQAQTTKVFDLTAYPLRVQIPTMPAVGNGSKQTQFVIGDGTNTAFFIFQGTPTTIFTGGTGLSQTSAVAYSAASHQYFRIRLLAGNLVFEVSADDATWTALRSVAAPAWVTAGLLQVTLSSGYYGTETASYAAFDNFNL